MSMHPTAKAINTAIEALEVLPPSHRRNLALTLLWDWKAKESTPPSAFNLSPNYKES